MDITHAYLLHDRLERLSKNTLFEDFLPLTHLLYQASDAFSPPFGSKSETSSGRKMVLLYRWVKTVHFINQIYEPWVALTA